MNFILLPCTYQNHKDMEIKTTLVSASKSGANISRWFSITLDGEKYIAHSYNSGIAWIYKGENKKTGIRIEHAEIFNAIKELIK